LWENGAEFGNRRISPALDNEDVAVKSITPEIAALAAQFPDDYPRDPADRLIGATALAEGIVLVTRDENIRRSPLLRTTW
jgi:PIN domain nuclease of toxin-antitoxin system